MEEFSTDYIAEVMASSRSRMQQSQMAQMNATMAEYGRENKSELFTPEDSSAAVELGQQAVKVAEAGSLVEEALAAGQEYDSYSKSSAATQAGMQKKMKALGMLDDARQDVDIQSHVAEYVDPLTGETVGANNLEYATTSAYAGARQQAQERAGVDQRWEELHTAATGGRGMGSANFNIQQETEAGKSALDAIYQEYFTDTDAMNYGRDNYELDEYRALTEMNDIYNSTKSSAYQFTGEQLDAERQMRIDQAQGSTDAYNMQQQQSQLIADKNNAEIVANQDDLKKSIRKDQQNLASQSASTRTPAGQTKLKDTVAFNRPV